MDKMKEGIQRRARRMQENLQQSVGLSEKRDELQRINHIEQRNQKMIAAVKNTRQNLQSCIRSGNGDDRVEKRKKKMEEYDLWQQLQNDAKDLEACFPRDEPPVLAEILRIYGEAVGGVLEDKVLTDQLIEKIAIKGLSKYIEDEKALSRAKEKLANKTVDVEVIRKRCHGNHDDSKAQEIQEEYDSAQSKLENFKDSVYTDIFNLSSKQTEIGFIFRDLIDVQAEFHRSALHKLENALPEVERKIACYPKRPVFGCHLEDHLRYTNRSIAVVLEVCCCALVRYGLNEKGLFRVNGNNNRIRRMKAAFDAHQMDGNSVEQSEYITDPHSICSVLKSYLRELPEPLMTKSLHNSWVQIARLDVGSRVDAISSLLPRLPAANRLNLAYLIRFLQLLLKYEKQTMMNAANLAIVFGPNLMYEGLGSESENILGARLVETLLQNADVFFPDDHFDFVAGTVDSSNQHHVAECSDPLMSDQLSSRVTHVPTKTPTTVSCASSDGVPLQRHNSSTHQSSTLSRRPKLPAPPPPSQSTNSSVVQSSSSHEIELSSDTEQLNRSHTKCRKSPSVASNDSLTGCGDAENVDELAARQQPLSRSYCESNRPIRPPPPKVSPSLCQMSPDSSSSPRTVGLSRPVSYLSAVSTERDTMTQSAPSSNNETSLSVTSTRSCVDENHRTLLQLDSEPRSCAQPSSPICLVSTASVSIKPPIPMKPKNPTDLKANEVTKL
ncbi:hypothetical protein AB6A40_001461 [Gnathostoma spinigerum]|uniref:Rho-GAP domain-containing protein n=1 Tax=Gnathostoma spinigerum TaxID=75299 RepID=A0ABD6EE20_9BILA